MRILFIHHSGLLGGAGVSLLNVIDSVRSEGHEAILSVSPSPADMLELANKRGINTLVSDRRIGAITYVSGIDGAFSPRFMYRLMLIFMQARRWNKTIRNTDPDLVVVNSKTLCWMSRLSEVKKRRSICFVRETMRGDRNNLLNRRIAKALDEFSAVSFISDYDRRLEGLQKAQTSVIYNYVEDVPMPNTEAVLQKADVWGLKEGRFRVLYAGGVNEMKGFHIAVRAVLAMGEDVDLIAAGADFDDVIKLGNRKATAFAGEMRAYIQANDQHGQIHLIGKQTDMASCYAACDVLIFPMQSPHQARPVFEAGYFGKPVVISDFENIREFVRDGDNGLTAKAGSEDDFAQKLTLLKQDKALKNELGENNRRRALAKHSRAANRAAVSKLINEVCR